MSDKILPVILCGGTGTRLWPVSREGMAKQLLPILGDQTLLQMTLARVAGNGFGAPMVIGAHAVRFTIRDQVEAVAPEARVVIEPERRDTLAAVLLAAAIAAVDDPDQVLAVMPSDHLIRDASALSEAVHTAAGSVRKSGIALVGVTPTGPSTGLGYIKPGATAKDGTSVVERFVEKPDETRAERLIAEGCLWNAGMFCFRAGWLIEAVRVVEPETVEQVTQAVADMIEDLGMWVPGKSFGKARAISFDHGFMEKTTEARVAPGQFRWSDVGDWDAVWTESDKDAGGNAIRGDGFAFEAKDNLIHSEGRLVCAVGVEGLAIIETPDAIMVAPREKAQDVKGLVGALKGADRAEAVEHIRNHRPWGWYQTMDLGERFRVKRIVVKPGAKLSLQKHHHRAEHWVVVRGTAEVTVDAKVSILHENESVYIPIGSVHRLANPGKIPVEIIEVQTGSYLEEDDIERIEDEFGRT
ncbi:mannose-1-phosphate guanylyltransferase/mannose-6-phosphate isomerase [Defluviimonas aestuarii]|uniref:mannose-1-phosphate guanylyltransferase/mannose-6-phosphate isomerase n=1 Tax=Albidovulum aestuarii TaxID=1130726 RepID=UPI00249B260A|nr:mannose-1-phosphate guanylyltransferase/mannose-6-phosphate isomerase [Defluviimonas aestuarii]MDI3335766.1 mannose-1-phosphate guanylyltransferase/mannose-6-phosphate isomerase [Defluviimonas aestuarii]